MKLSASRSITVLLLIAGIITLADAIWIPVKAEVAQHLLEHAWERARHGEADARPWIWADTTPVARLAFPDHGEEMLVLEGASGRTMAFGPGHLNGTSSPGAGGNCVIAGHRDTHFRILERVDQGDRLEIGTVDGRNRRYVVASTRIVTEDRTDVLRQDGGERVTLITCYPFDAIRPGGPLRLVVVATPERAVR
ncbi:MAG: class GN sortase [Thermoanaerobaculia bacterium]|nr:class GN sortase [Thermoanaerobaculia bacterium]